MARFPVRELFSFRNTILSYPSNISSRHCISSSFYRSSSTALEFEFEKSKSSNRYQCLALLDANRSMTQVSQIHVYLITTSYFDSFWARKLLKVYWDFGDVDFTILLFRYIDYPGTFCINTVIEGYSMSSTAHQAVVLYFELLRIGFCPNNHIFVPLIWCCAKIGCVESGRKCRGQAVKNGVNYELPVQNSLINMYGQCLKVELAYKVFNEMLIWDLFSWYSLVDGYARFGSIDVAHGVFDAMPTRNVASWNIIMGVYLKGGVPGFVLKLFRKMVKIGLRGNDTTMVNVLSACS